MPPVEPSELTPRRLRGATSSGSARELAWSYALGLAIAVAFYATLLFGGSLHGYDWGSHHYNYFDWVRISLTDFHTLPLFMNDAWVTKNFLANAESPILGPLVALLCVLSTGAYIKLLLVAFTAAGFAGMFFLLREFGIRREIACFVATVFAFNGFFVSHLSVGHPWVMGGQLLPALVCSYRRAVLGHSGALWIAAGINACTILGGQHQPFIWQNLFLAFLALLWAIRARDARPIRSWALLVLATTGLGAVKLLPMLAEFADYDPTARVPGLPLSLVFTTFLAGGQQPEWAPPGISYDHGSGWWEYAFYVGPIAFGCLAVGLLRARRCWPTAVIAAGFFVLAIEWPPPVQGFDPWSWLEGLPIWRTQRGPSRFLFPALFGVAVVSAVGLQRLWERDLGRWPRAAPLAGAALCLLAAAELHSASLPWQRGALGPALSSRDHRPHPLVLGTPGVVSAKLTGFAPNRLVYHVRAERPGRIVFPFRYGRGAAEWRIEGLEGPTAASGRTDSRRLLSEGGKLAIDLSVGEADIAMVYRPRLFTTGWVTSAVTLLVALGALIRSRSYRGRPAACRTSA